MKGWDVIFHTRFWQACSATAKSLRQTVVWFTLSNFVLRFRNSHGRQEHRDLHRRCRAWRSRCGQLPQVKGRIQICCTDNSVSGSSCSCISSTRVSTSIFAPIACSDWAKRSSSTCCCSSSCRNIHRKSSQDHPSWIPRSVSECGSAQHMDRSLSQPTVLQQTAVHVVLTRTITFFLSIGPFNDFFSREGYVASYNVSAQLIWM